MATRIRPFVVFDVGHGGKDPGVTRQLPTGIFKESNVNLNVSRKLNQLISDDGNKLVTAFTRTSDVFISLQDRVRKINGYQISGGQKPDLIVSIHHNGSANQKIHGAEIVYDSRAPFMNETRRFASFLSAEFMKIGQELSPRGVFCEKSSVDPHRNRLYIMRSAFPSVVGEFAYVNTPDYEIIDQLRDQEREAEAYYRALISLFSL